LLDRGAHTPLQAGLPALPLPEQLEFGGEGGQATLLWLGDGGAAGGASGTSVSPGTAPFDGEQPPSEGSSPASAAAPDVALPFATDLLLPVQGDLALLASSRLQAPALALCRTDGPQLQQRGAAVPLPLPISISDCSVRLRGLAVSPALGSGGQEQLVWALLAAAPRPKAAPFLGAALGGHPPQQLVLCCYPLQQLVQLAERAAGGAAGEPAAAPLQPAAVAAPAAAAAATPADAMQAMQALQGEVAALRAEVNARLDGLAAQLGQLMGALQQRRET
jgi:hypothetical protein